MHQVEVLWSHSCCGLLWTCTREARGALAKEMLRELGVTHKTSSHRICLLYWSVLSMMTEYASTCA